ncbi:hypothetical protein LPJ60_002279 [Coemansia sp. RSA 2675]|uniref:Uncharacterized protein n=1 Tax=Coemansia linderi TaxID=2663919 RepID=A0ACC1KBV3_9FUNG|nr:hypothetical protein LPJ60_002279 [Coemansia sp. RSA 2675]KAJ2783344.1 hypothetical protein GGI18_003526 [Coemansia linderi]
MYNVRLVHANNTQLLKSGNRPSRRLADIVQEECPSLAPGARFTPSPLVPGGHAQTIYAFLGYYVYYAHSLISPRFTRETFGLSDGGNVVLDWALCKDHMERPVVTVLSGVTGTSCDYYVRKCYEELIRLQYSVVVVHSRGSNIMAKYIGEEGADCPLAAGIIVGNPYDMYKVINHLDSRSLSLNKIYDVAILNFLKTAFKENQEAILSAPVKFNVSKIANSSTIMEFTEEMTRKAFRYTSAKHLLDDSSSLDYLDSIRIPVLFLNSLDDPICTPSLIPFDKFLSNPWLLLALARHGGHIGYMGSTWPTSWIEHPVSQFFKSMLSHTASEKPDTP